jgi:hypothetical protein
LWVPDDVLLSHGIHRTIIGAESFHGPVRNGKGWDQLAIVVKRSLLSAGILAWALQPALAIGRSKSLLSRSYLANPCHLRALAESHAHGYRIKPHGQLVPVSSKDYSSYTPGLSTRWSSATLQGGQAPGKSNLKASFPLRCFQRLSLPHIATRRCHWRDNRYTRGASTPVLSY